MTATSEAFSDLFNSNPKAKRIAAYMAGRDGNVYPCTSRDELASWFEGFAGAVMAAREGRE